MAVKKGGKFLIAILAVVALFGAAYFSGALDNMDTAIPGGDKKSSQSADVPDDVKVVNVCVVTWGGYAGGQYFNEGFEPTTNSRFYKDYGFMVRFVLNDDFNSSRAAWKAGNVDLMWATTGSFSTEVVGMKELKPQIIFQADWSRGGDAVVVRRGIDNVSQLRGKSIAVATMTPSHTFFLNLLEAGGLVQSDVKLVEVPNAIDAAAMFKTGEVDAAVVWSPDDMTCVKAVDGSRVLQSTKDASNIIADIFFAKKEFTDANPKIIEQLVEGWMKGAAEINSSETNKRRAAEILSDGLNISVDDAIGCINNVRLTTLGDNKNFFGLNSDFHGVTGERLYTEMTSKYKTAGYIRPNENTYWRDVANADFVQTIRLSGAEHDAEGQATFTAPTAEMYDDTKVQAVSQKKVTITFATSASALDKNSQYIIDKEFVNIAKKFSNARIRIAGNTDATGGASGNETLSKKRAQSVADYLATTHGFDRNRFVVVGNGPKQAIADGVTGSNEDYRRTDFELIGQ